MAKDMKARPWHTPGPWEYKKEFGREGLILTPEGEAIAAFMPDGVGNEERMEANARLIAAAPDLLAACKLAESVYRLNIVQEGEPSSVLSALQAAIAKATGERS